MFNICSIPNEIPNEKLPPPNEIVAFRLRDKLQTSKHPGDHCERGHLPGERLPPELEIPHDFGMTVKYGEMIGEIYRENQGKY